MSRPVFGFHPVQIFGGKTSRFSSVNDEVARRNELVREHRRRAAAVESDTLKAARGSGCPIEIAQEAAARGATTDPRCLGDAAPRPQLVLIFVTLFSVRALSCFLED